MTIPTESIGSLPRPRDLQQAHEDFMSKKIDRKSYDEVLEMNLEHFVNSLESIGSPVITDGEVFKQSFALYPIAGVDVDPNGATIPFNDGHVRQLPTIKGPVKFTQYAYQFLEKTKSKTSTPVKATVISPSALSLLYPSTELPNYSREKYIQDILNESEKDIKQCLSLGADSVQIDATELRLALKLDPSGGLIDQFVSLNNQLLSRFNDQEIQKIGIHTCPGSDQDSCHSQDVDYAQLIPYLFKINVGRVYMSLASESDKERILSVIRDNYKPNQKLFFGVIDVCDPRVETPQEVCDRIMEIARFIPLEQIGTCDDCGFSPFCDDQSTSFATAIAKINVRIEGTNLASKQLGI
ncbi:hypothetical protein CYY_006699 [Polysphondylium violaceum]|uniref:Cobalamin-independent methionine synthase MetE C-terminal/archaeal domain-containing protein n=1 Tax=Polysphondylium violaceum TaxID=133409 RepID=A0A8J4URC6_9MYCE|nr:hypothetical protein CYY_006699 [Polysphondylium violaceum]